MFGVPKTTLVALHVTPELTVIGAKGLIIIGKILSVTVTVKEHVAVFAPLVVTKVKVLVPKAKVPPLGKPNV